MMQWTRYKLWRMTQICGTTIMCTRRRIVPRGDRVVDRKAQCERRTKGRYLKALLRAQPISFTPTRRKPLNKSLGSTPGTSLGSENVQAKPADVRAKHRAESACPFNHL